MDKNKILTIIQTVIIMVVVIVGGVKYQEYTKIQEVKQTAIEGNLLGKEFIDNYQEEFREIEIESKDPFKESGYVSRGEAGVVGVIKIPKINVKEPIYMGTSDEVLKQGVGLIEGTDIPRNDVGLSSQIAGHRGYMGVGFLFQKVNKLVAGDKIEIETSEGVLEYEVVRQHVVEPSETDKYLQDEDESYITLVTCTPMYNWANRLLVEARLVR